MLADALPAVFYVKGDGTAEAEANRVAGVIRRSLRDEFAKAALTGLLSNENTESYTKEARKELASRAYAIAEAVVEERARREEG